MVESKSPKRPRPESPWKTLFHISLPLERETSLFIMVSALDVFMTYMLLRYSHDGRTNAVIRESNPIAAFFFSRWGMRGMVYFKFGLVAVVAVIAQVVARERIETARWLLNIGTIVVGGVVIYSLILLFKNTVGL